MLSAHTVRIKYIHELDKMNGLKHWFAWNCYCKISNFLNKERKKIQWKKPRKRQSGRGNC